MDTQSKPKDQGLARASIDTVNARNRWSSA